MKYEINNTTNLIFSSIFSLFVFMSLTLPSLKLFYSSSLLNIIALMGIIITGAIRNYLNKKPLIMIDPNKLHFIILLTLLWISLMVISFFFNIHYFTFGNVVRYFSVVLFALSISIYTKNEDLLRIIFLVIAWGLFIAVLETYVGIPKDRSLGQHYLTSGVAISSAILPSIGIILSRYYDKKIKYLLVPCVLLMFQGLSGLSGRAPILLSVLIPTLVLLILILFTKGLLRKLIITIILIVVLLIVSYFINELIPTTTLDRILRIFTNIQEEPRLEVYRTSFEIISENLFGIGFQSFNNFGISYPHNIFLEVLAIGGIIMIVPLGLVFLPLMIISLKVIKMNDIVMPFLLLFLYFFFTWNISFDLASSYLLFNSLALFYSGYIHRKNNLFGGS